MRAAETLGRIKDERGVMPLVMALKDQSAGEEAALAIRNFDPSVLAEELSKAFTHEDRFVRRKAVTYAPYYCIDSSLIVEMSQLPESDPAALAALGLDFGPRTAEEQRTVGMSVLFPSHNCPSWLRECGASVMTYDGLLVAIDMKTKGHNVNQAVVRDLHVG